MTKKKQDELLQIKNMPVTVIKESIESVRVKLWYSLKVEPKDRDLKKKGKENKYRMSNIQLIVD